MEKVKAIRRWRVRIRAVDSRIIWTGKKLDKIIRRRKKGLKYNENNQHLKKSSANNSFSNEHLEKATLQWKSSWSWFYKLILPRIGIKS